MNELHETPAGDTLSLLLHSHHRFLAFLQRRTGSRETAEELLQSAFAKAEAVAFVVSRAIGLECGTHASDYIQLYQGDSNTLCSSLSLIQSTAGGILKELLSTQGSPSKEDA